MHAALAPNISIRAFYDVLNRMGITYQRSEQKRAIFAEQIKDIAVEQIVYIDETCVDNNMSPLRGWAKKGVKSFTEALDFRTKRITLIGGYCYGAKELLVIRDMTINRR